MSAAQYHPYIASTTTRGFSHTAEEKEQTQFPDAWLRSAQVTNAAGQRPSSAVLNQLCPQFVQAAHGHGDMAAARKTCVTNLSATFQQTVVYQPASRYWPFQWAELGVFTALAFTLAAFSAWWIRHRLA